MDHLTFALFLLIVSWLFAMLEIQVEGRYGWAQKLPTWRLENRWTKIFFNGRTLTGYHLYAQAFVFFMAHLPFSLRMVPWTWNLELRIIAFLVLFWVLEDFLWFVCNRAYGLRNFRPERIAWHRDSWWWIAPRDYWIGAPLGILLYLLAAANG